MKIEIKDGPTIQQLSTGKATDARARAIEKLVGSNAPEGSVSMQQTQSGATQNDPFLQAQVAAKRAESKGNVQNNTNEATQDANLEASESSKPASEESKSSEEAPLSKQYAIIARKEKALRNKMQELKAKEAELESKAKSLESTGKVDESKYIALDSLQSDPITTLLRAGISYDQITQMVMAQPQVDPATKVMMDELKAEINRMKEDQQSSRKAAEEQQTKAYNQAVEGIRKKVVSLVDSSEDFETIKATGSHNDVVELIKATYKSDGIILSEEEAAREVEEYLVDELAKYAKLQKIQKKLTPPTKPASEQQTATQQQQQMKTLTNNVGSSRPLSARERALLAFEGKLK